MTIDAAADAARRIVEAARARWEQSRQANPTAPSLDRRGQSRASDAHRSSTRSSDQRSDARAFARRAARSDVKTQKTKNSMADDLSMNPSRDDFAALLDESLGGARLRRRHGGQGPGGGDREGLRHHRRGPEDRRPHPGEGIRRRRRRQGDPEGRRHGRGVPRAGRERAGRSGDQPRQGPPRRGLDPPGRRLRQERAGDGLHRRPREGRLHRRPRRRLGLPAGLARSTSARCATSAR